MRNLKRALSLGLTAAMISGLMVMGSSAASYADVTSENNVEAIEVLEAVGIMIGDENGNFNPDQNVTRNEMAVVMSNLMEYNVASYRGTSPFTDVPSWAEPYVAACWTNGITAGTSATTYGGDQTVTTAQAALMLMKALGYFQYAQDFGNDWQLATVRQANDIVLFVGVDSGVEQAMTRNDVAQLVLNTLEAGTVTASTDGSLSVGNVTIATNVSYNYVTSNEPYARAISTVRSTNTTTDATQSIVELGEQLYMGDLTRVEYEENGFTDVFGRPATQWEYQTEEIGTYNETSTYTFTDKVTSKELYDAIGRTAMDYNTWHVYVDGFEVEYNGSDLSRNRTDNNKDFLEEAGVAIPADVWNQQATGNGVLTQVYVDGTDRAVYVSLIHYYAAEVHAVDEEDGVITLNAFYGNAETNDEFETTDFAEEDVVMYSFANNEIQEVYAAEQIEGEVTRVRSDTTNGTENDGDNFTADGTDYNYNKTMLSDDRLRIENVDNNMVGYVDQYGYVSYIDESAMTYDYAYVLSMWYGDDEYGVAPDGSKGQTVYARLVLTDGTLVKAETDVRARDAEDFDNDGDKTIAEAIQTYNNHIVSYNVDSNDVYSLDIRDNYVMDKTNGTDGIQNAVDDNALNIENGVAAFDAVRGWTANSNTVYIVADSDPDSYDDYDFTVFTGFKNVPDITGQAGAQVDVATNENDVAKVVYIEDADVAGAGDVTYALADRNPKVVRNQGSSDYFEIKAVRGGEVVTLKVLDGSPASQKLVYQPEDYETGDMLEVDWDANNDATQWIVALESVTENSDGLVTNVRLVDNDNLVADGDGYVTGMGTVRDESDIVGLKSIDQFGEATRSYSWDDDVAVVRFDPEADAFEVSRISSVNDDEDDTYLGVLSGRVLTGLCIVEYNEDEVVVINDNVVVNEEDNITLEVEDNANVEANALGVSMTDDGYISYNFKVAEKTRAVGDIIGVNYTETIYRNDRVADVNDIENATVREDGRVYATTEVRIDANDEVRVEVSDIELILEGTPESEFNGDVAWSASTAPEVVNAFYDETKGTVEMTLKAQAEDNAALPNGSNVEVGYTIIDNRGGVFADSKKLTATVENGYVKISVPVTPNTGATEITITDIEMPADVNEATWDMMIGNADKYNTELITTSVLNDENTVKSPVIFKITLPEELQDAAEVSVQYSVNGTAMSTPITTKGTITDTETGEGLDAAKYAIKDGVLYVRGYDLTWQKADVTIEVTGVEATETGVDVTYTGVGVDETKANTTTVVKGKSETIQFYVDVPTGASKLTVEYYVNGGATQQATVDKTGKVTVSEATYNDDVVVNISRVYATEYTLSVTGNDNVKLGTTQAVAVDGTTDVNNATLTVADKNGKTATIIFTVTNGTSNAGKGSAAGQYKITTDAISDGRATVEFGTITPDGTGAVTITIVSVSYSA